MNIPCPRKKKNLICKWNSFTDLQNNEVKQQTILKNILTSVFAGDRGVYEPKKEV